MLTEPIGYIASILIGVSLGLIGAGGSILTVPVLVYLFHVPALEATGMSLFVVGLSAAVGSVRYFRQSLVNVNTALYFGIPSVLAVFLTRWLLLPMLPDPILVTDGLLLSRSTFLLGLFALLMIAASMSMMGVFVTKEKQTQASSINYLLIILSGFVEGSLSGLLGAGGGFLIIPALVVLCRISMKEAIGTSLGIIAVKSLIGFFAGLGGINVDFLLLFKVSGLAVLGIFAGTALGRQISGEKLKPAFGWFLLLMGTYILLRETHLLEHIK
jgi:uncharacterized membrane protein YfcA